MKYTGFMHKINNKEANKKKFLRYVFWVCDFASFVFFNNLLDFYQNVGIYIS